MCAIFGVNLNTGEDTGAAAVGVTYNGLLALQHRGQEGAGIAVVNDNHIHYHKNVGLVAEVFTPEILQALPKGSVAVGHTRYSTTGGNRKENVGPFVTDYLTGRIATAHNGNITNAREIREYLRNCGLRFEATNDSEVISQLIGYCITKEGGTVRGTIKAAECLRGAFSLIIASGKNKLIAVRDPDGFRPLCIGKNESGYAIASESCALDSCGFAFVRDVLPGEVVVIENGEIVYNDVKLSTKSNKGLCIFEYVYFARPDSIIDKLSVYEARINMGATLAEEFPVDADIVCGVPDSGLDAAKGYSLRSGIPFASGFVKNRYIGRSFIYPDQIQRDSAVRLKLNPLAASVKGKRIVLVDDSIVRGTTSEKIVRSLKNAGAVEVHMRISSPPFKFTCNYGTDIDEECNLIYNKMDRARQGSPAAATGFGAEPHLVDAIRQKIGADSLGYISIEGLKKACAGSDMRFCTACFTGGNCAQKRRAFARKNIFEEG